MEAREVLDLALGMVDGNQAELARRLKRSETTVSRWATGRNGIDFESALRLARMTKLPAREVVKSCGLDPDLVPVGTDADQVHGDAELANFIAVIEAEWRATDDAASRNMAIAATRAVWSALRDATTSHSGRHMQARKTRRTQQSTDPSGSDGTQGVWLSRLHQLIAPAPAAS